MLATGESWRQYPPALADLWLQKLAEKLNPVGSLLKYDTFKSRFFSDPVGFVHDCIRWPAGQSPAEYQIDVLESFMDARRFSLRGPRGLGKTALSAWIIHWFALTRDGRDWKIPTTASSWTQLTKFL